MRGLHIMGSELQKFLTSTPGITAFPPATTKDISKISQNLARFDISNIADDYCSFLKQTDGLIFNDIELYGCNTHKRKTYEFPNIEFIVQLTTDNSFFKNNIIIGLMSEEIILYNGKNHFYAVADRVTLDYLAQYKSFFELLSALAAL